jgi:hypothetical protein
MSSTDFINIAQTFVLALVGSPRFTQSSSCARNSVAQPTILHAMSMAMGEQSDLKRRVNDLENEVADLTMRG